MENHWYYWMAVVIGELGAATIFLSAARYKIITFGVLGVFYIVFASIFFYYALPVLSRPLLGSFGFALFIFWLLTWFVSSVLPKEAGPHKLKNYQQWPPIIYVAVMIIIFFADIYGVGIENKIIINTNLENEVKKYWACNPELKKIIPQDLAITYAGRALSNTDMEKYFVIDKAHVTLQINKGVYWYLVPLDFKDDRSWQEKLEIPGYYKILASDPLANPVLVYGLKIKYTPGAFLDNNLGRKLYFEYFNRFLPVNSFQEDDSGRVFWIIDVTKTNFFSWDNQKEGIIIYDPETGGHEYVPQNKLSGLQYSWIDGNIPTKVFQNLILD